MSLFKLLLCVFRLIYLILENVDDSEDWESTFLVWCLKIFCYVLNFVQSTQEEALILLLEQQDAGLFEQVGPFGILGVHQPVYDCIISFLLALIGVHSKISCVLLLLKEGGLTFANLIEIIKKALELGVILVL